MATHTDELVTLLSLKGDGAFAAGMNRAGGALSGFAVRHKESLGLLATIGPGFTSAGNGMVGFSTSAINAYKTAQNIDNELESLARKQGWSEKQIASMKAFATELQRTGGINDETTKKTASLMASFKMTPEEIQRFLPAVAMQAKLTGSSMESVGMAMGKAFGSGQYGMLARFGVTMSVADRETLKYLQTVEKTGSATEAAAAKQKAMDIIFNALEENVAPLSTRLNTLEGQQERFAATADDVREKLGAGVAGVQQYGYAMGYHLLRHLDSLSPAALSGAGGLVYLGGKLAQGVGTVGQFAHSLLAIQASLGMIKGAETAATTARTLGIPPTVAAAGANTAGAAAASGAAGANMTLARSLWAAYTPLAVLVAALAAATLWYRNYIVAAEAAAEREYGRETEEFTDVMLARKGQKRDKTGAVVRDEKATAESMAVAERKFQEQSGQKRNTSFRTVGDQSWLNGNRGAMQAPIAGQGGFPLPPEMGGGNYNPQGNAKAVRMPNGVLRIQTDVQGGAGINENDLRTYNLVTG